MNALDNLFQKDVKQFYGQVIEKNGSRYTLKDQQDRVVYAYSNVTYRVGQWVLSENNNVVQAVNAPNIIKIYEV